MSLFAMIKNNRTPNTICMQCMSVENIICSWGNEWTSMNIIEITKNPTQTMRIMMDTNIVKCQSLLIRISN